MNIPQLFTFTAAKWHLNFCQLSVHCLLAPNSQFSPALWKWAGTFQHLSFVHWQQSLVKKEYCETSQERRTLLPSSRYSHCSILQTAWQVQSLGWEDSPGEGNGNPLQYSCLEKSHGWRNLAGYIAHGGHKESDTTEKLHFKGQARPVSHHWSPERTLSCKANAQTPCESSSSHNYSIQLRWLIPPGHSPPSQSADPTGSPRAWITAGTSLQQKSAFPDASCATWTSAHLDTITLSQKDKNTAY